MRMNCIELSRFLKMRIDTARSIFDGWRFSKFRISGRPVMYEVDEEFLDLLEDFISTRPSKKGISGVELLRKILQTTKSITVA